MGAVVHIDLDDKPYLEILDGRCVRKVSPKRKHAVLQWRIAALIDRLGGSFGQVATEWRFHLPAGGNGATTLVPDVAWVALERLRSLSENAREEPPFAPDIVVEVRSPSDREAHIAAKIAAYLANGSLVVLDVDPDREVITAHERGGSTTFSRGDFFQCSSVPWLRFETAPLFASLEI
ncbi:MAG TPA: Uma2 family endonuclease [Candidatus Baltobacteraceae bacterium]|jgi:Uma2 family endonuclease